MKKEILLLDKTENTLDEAMLLARNTLKIQQEQLNVLKRIEAILTKKSKK